MKYNEFRDKLNNLKEEFLRQNEENFFDIVSIISIIKGIDFAEALESPEEDLLKYNNISIDFIDVFKGCTRKINHLTIKGKKINIPDILTAKVKNWVDFQDIIKRINNENLTPEILENLFVKDTETLSDEIIEHLTDFSKKILFGILTNADKLVSNFINVDIKDIQEVYFYDVIYTAFFLTRKYTNISTILTLEPLAKELKISFLNQILNVRSSITFSKIKIIQKFYLRLMKSICLNYSSLKIFRLKRLEPLMLWYSMSLLRF